MVLNFTDPFLTTRVLGFESLFDRLQRLSESQDRSSYPPYNIRRNENQIFIDVAVAGLSKDDLSIELADGVLTVEHAGPQAEVVNGTNEVVYQGMDWKNINDLIPKNFKNGSKYKRTGKAGIFAGSLELVKEGNLSIKQDNLFDDIYVREIND